MFYDFHLAQTNLKLCDVSLAKDLLHEYLTGQIIDDSFCVSTPRDRDQRQCCGSALWRSYRQGTGPARHLCTHTD